MSPGFEFDPSKDNIDPSMIAAREEAKKEGFLEDGVPIVFEPPQAVEQLQDIRLQKAGGVRNVQQKQAE